MNSYVVFIVLMTQVAGCLAATPDPNQPVDPSTLSLEQIVQHVQTAGRKLTTYRADLVYEVNQPELETCMIRTGSMMARRDPNQSWLRVEFDTLQQDDLPREQAKEVFVFDGIWLTDLNYDAKSVTQRQMTPVDKPTDAFELASQSMPLIGFTDMKELTEHCDLARIELTDHPQWVGLLLKVKPESDYSKDYTQLTFEIDPVHWLPAKVVALAPVGDIHTIEFKSPQLNGPIEKTAFLVQTPAGFGKPEVIPLENQ